MAEEKTAKRSGKTLKSACAQCKKRLGQKSWYYRDTQYYCNKRCWKSASTAASSAE